MNLSEWFNVHMSASLDCLGGGVSLVNGEMPPFKP